jgi:hypothetical protein
MKMVGSATLCTTKRFEVVHLDNISLQYLSTSKIIEDSVNGATFFDVHEMVGADVRKRTEVGLA